MIPSSMIWCKIDSEKNDRLNINWCDQIATLDHICNFNKNKNREIINKTGLDVALMLLTKENMAMMKREHVP